jgi:hypothetical protein
MVLPEKIGERKRKGPRRALCLLDWDCYDIVNGRFRFHMDATMSTTTPWQ